MDALPRGLPADAVLVARVGRPHGVRGELRLIPESGDPGRLLHLERVWVAAPDDAEASEATIQSARQHQAVALVRLAGIDTPEAASRLTHSGVWASRADLPVRAGDEFDVDEVLGATLFDGETAVGSIVGVSSGGGRDFFDVEAGGRRHLVPAVKDWLVEFDRPGRRIVMRLPEGLLED